MFNVAVFKLKDIMNNLVKIILLILIVIIFTRFFSYVSGKSNMERDIGKKNKTFDVQVFTQNCIQKEITLIGKIDNKYEKNELYKLDIQDFLKTEISAINVLNEKKQDIQEENINETIMTNIDKNNSNKNEDVKSNVNTEIVTNNPISDNYNIVYKNIKIKNGTKINLTDEVLNPDIKIDNKNVLIFHTHSCESYTSSELFPYTPTGNFRSTDLNYTVTRVGTEFENQLKKYNINTYHDMTYHDYPAYNGSYTRSLSTVQNILQTFSSDIIIDLHRDAIGSRSDYAPTVKIGDDFCAQIMYVIGTNEGGLQHPNWQQNIKFAVKVQSKAEEMYPGLFKTMSVTENRYNQHTGKFASIIEVGATGNTLEQCLNSMKYLGEVFDEILNE